MKKIEHKERAHSKYSASGSERWLNCPASVPLEEACPPSPDSPWSLEGTFAHEVLEHRLKNIPLNKLEKSVPTEMLRHVDYAADLIKKILGETWSGELIVEERIYNDNIDAEMFGTCDAVVVELFSTLDIIDFKYGQGHIVNPEKNTQLIQYALGYANKYNWNFDKIRMHIIQPRTAAKHKTWTITTRELHDFWLTLFVKGVKRVRTGHNKPFPGNWCHWCRAKLTCPAKVEQVVAKVSHLFNSNPLPFEGDINGKKENQKEDYKKSNQENWFEEESAESEDFY